MSSNVGFAPVACPDCLAGKCPRHTQEMPGLKKMWEQVVGRPETVIQEAGRIVDGDREQTYGHPALNFERTAVLASVVFGHPVTVKQVALFMVCLKIAREVHQHKRDNLVDGIGYFRCIEKMETAGTDLDRPLGYDPDEDVKAEAP